MISNFSNIAEAISWTREMLKTYGEVVVTESWQGIKRDASFFEYINLYWAAQMPNDLKSMQNLIKPDQPWADAHFGERTNTDQWPYNPGETYKIWPGYKDQKYNDENFKAGGKFSHTYMERYWPKYAQDGAIRYEGANKVGRTNMGIRFPYGDLYDVVNLIREEPNTRQAYLPIWFPEDTGVLHKGRVPCTLGYHFLMRHNKLNIHYTIRACDYLRHFRNDVYLTCRLALWVLQQLQEGLNQEWQEVNLGLMTFDCMSLHVFEQEKAKI